MKLDANVYDGWKGKKRELVVYYSHFGIIIGEKKEVQTLFYVKPMRMFSKKVLYKKKIFCFLFWITKWQPD